MGPHSRSIINYNIKIQFSQQDLKRKYFKEIPLKEKEKGIYFCKTSNIDR